MLISIIIPTHDRVGLLEQALESMSQVETDGLPEIELVVIQNCPGDGTKELVDRMASRFPWACRSVEETRKGSCPARNRGIQETRGEIVVFTDDDVSFHPGWLKAIAKAFEDPQVGMVGGRVLPRFSCPIPSWFSLERFPGVCVCYDLGENGVTLEETHPMPYSANAALRRTVLDEIGGFRTDLGRIPGRLLGAEDTDFLLRAVRTGTTARYVPDALVYHPIGEDRLNREFVRLWIADGGICWARFRFEQEKTFSRLFGVPRHMVKTFGVNLLKWFAALVLLRTKDRFFYRMEICYCRNFCREFRRLVRDNRKNT